MTAKLALGHYRAQLAAWGVDVDEWVREAVAAAMLDHLERQQVFDRLESIMGGVIRRRNLDVVATELRALADEIDPPGAIGMAA